MYLLSGSLRCGECASVMRAFSTTAGRRYYRCSTRIEHRGSCQQLSVKADEIENRAATLMRGLEIGSYWQEHLLS